MPEKVDPEIEVIDTNTVRLTFQNPPGADAMRVRIVGFNRLGSTDGGDIPDDGGGGGYPYLSFASKNISNPDGTGFVYSDHVLHFATKASGTWVVTDVDSGSGNTSLNYYGRSLIGHTGDEFLIYTRTGGQLFYSSNAGATWAEVIDHDLPQNNYMLRLTYQNGHWLIFNDDGEVWTSSDRSTWTQATATTVPLVFPAYTWETGADTSGILHMATTTTLEYTRSTDEGENWADEALNADTGSTWGHMVVAGGVIAVVTPTFPDLECYVSTDNGATWSAAATLDASSVANLDDADRGGIGGGSYHSYDYVALKVISTDLYVFCTACWDMGTTTYGDDQYNLVVFKSTDWMTGTPTFSYFGQTLEDVLVGWDGAGWANSDDGEHGCLVFAGSKHIALDTSTNSEVGIREVDETLAGDGDLVWSTGDAYAGNILPDNPALGETKENLEGWDDISVGWHE